MTNDNKRKKKKKYFDEEEELAVVEFINSETQEERSRIYNEKLKYAIEKLAESLINRYKLHRKNITYEEVHSDVISFLMCQSSKFDPNNGGKAYSYYGTICVNYLRGELQKESNKINIHLDFDTSIDKLEEDNSFKYEIDSDEIDTNNLMSNIILEIQNTIDLYNEGKKKLTPNELKLGVALVELLSNWEVLFDENSNSYKYDKNSILATIRNYTNLSTKDIRVAMQKYKNLFKLIKNDLISNGS